MVAVWFDNLDANPALFDSGVVSVRVYGPDHEPLPSVPNQLGPATGVLEASSMVVFPADDYAGPFFVELVEWKVEEVARYIVRAEILERAFETEPNDSRATATLLGPLPASVAGYWSSGNDTADLYRLSLAGPLPALSSLVVELDNLEGSDNFTLALESPAGATLGTSQGPWPALQVAGLGEGDYFVRVTASGTQSPPYALRVELGPAMEIEPNDGAAQANALGALAGGSAIGIDGVAVARFTRSLHLRARTTHRRQRERGRACAEPRRSQHRAGGALRRAGPGHERAHRLRYGRDLPRHRNAGRDGPVRATDHRQR